MLVLNNN